MSIPVLETDKYELAIISCDIYFDGAHRASADALAAGLLFTYIVKYVKSDKEYRELIRYVLEHGFARAGDVITISEDEKFDLYRALSSHTSASRAQISKFLHFKVEYK